MKNTNPKISVIMSTYNEPLEWIKKSIDSILNQTFIDFEFIIINDNPDRIELQKFLENHKRQDKRIILIKNNKNSGLTKSLNEGLKIAKGKYIARMDADDISFLDRFKIQYEYLEKNNSIYLVGSGAILINEQESTIGAFTPLTDTKKIENRLKKTNCIYHPTIMFKNEKIFYREKMFYCEDYDLYLRLLSKDKQLSNISDTLIEYRINSNSISKSKKLYQKLFTKKAKDFYFQRAKNGFDDYKNFDFNKILNSNFFNSPIQIVYVILKIYYFKIEFIFKKMLYKMKNIF
ncbi:glycosyltransferase [Candidatus Parcubacteria bacterium]|nr:glycosyltransferase [Candidatus Parcubacteria bacterium]